MKYAMAVEIARGEDAETAALIAKHEMGLEFTADELKAAMQTVQEAAQAEADELSEEMLDQVAGGASLSVSGSYQGISAEGSMNQSGGRVSATTMAMGEEGGFFGPGLKVEKTFKW